jgi:Galactose oxidase, central domain/Kelch motif
LIVGGIDNTTIAGTHLGLSSAEIYDQKSGQFTATGSMSEGRVGQTATLLEDGSVLVTGGDGAETDHPVASTEIYDSKNGVFNLTGSMTTARVGHAATLLPNGQVLIAGGQDVTFTNLSTAEVFDPRTSSFVSTGSMSVARTGHTATLLDDGDVLIAGGENGTALLSSAELYHPATGSFTPTGGMAIPRLFATAILLKDRRVLIAGGGSVVGNCLGCSVASAEIHDPHSGTFTSTTSMEFPRRGQVAVLLKNGDVLVAAGIDDGLPDPQRFLNSAEIYDPHTSTFSATANMTMPRFDHTASLLKDGSVLIAGGFTGTFTITDTAELFDPAKAGVRADCHNDRRPSRANIDRSNLQMKRVRMMVHYQVYRRSGFGREGGFAGLERRFVELLKAELAARNTLPQEKRAVTSNAPFPLVPCLPRNSLPA